MCIIVVAHAATELLVEIFGESGKHARSAVGVAELPLGVYVLLHTRSTRYLFCSLL